MTTGTILSKDLTVCHHCDNGPCFRPIHLFGSDQRGNLADMCAKGRQEKGELHHYAKLNDVQVRKIFADYHEGSSFASLSRLFSVHEMTIRRIISGFTWKHLRLTIPPYASSRVT